MDLTKKAVEDAEQVILWQRVQGGQINHAWRKRNDGNTQYVSWDAICNPALVMTTQTWKNGTKDCPKCEKLVRSNATKKPVCEAKYEGHERVRDEGFKCTKELGHEGEHEEFNRFIGQVIARWSGSGAALWHAGQIRR